MKPSPAARALSSTLRLLRGALARACRGADGWALGLGCATALALGACGYQLVDERGALGPELRLIQLRSLENSTPESGFEALLGEALREEFARRGALRPILADGAARAPLVLDGNVFGASVRSTALSSVALSLEDSIEVMVNIAVTRSASGAVVWESSELRGSERFSASADPQVYESNKEQALRRIASRLAQEVHDSLFQAFVFESQPEN